MNMNNNITQFNKHHKRKQKQNKNGMRGSFPSLTIILAAVLLFGLIFAYMEFKEDSERYSDLPIEVAQSLPYISGEYVYYDDPGVPPEKENIWVMYNALSDVDKSIYELFLNLVENRDGENYTNAIIISDSDLAEIGEDYFWNVFYAMCYDHPEYFFISTEADPVTCSTLELDGYTTYLFHMKAASTHLRTVMNRQPRLQ